MLYRTISLAHTRDIGLVDLVLIFFLFSFFFGGGGRGHAPGRLELMKVHMSCFFNPGCFFLGFVYLSIVLLLPPLSNPYFLLVLLVLLLLLLRLRLLLRLLLMVFAGVQLFRLPRLRSNINSDGLQPHSDDGLHPSSDGLQSSSDGLPS